MDREASLLIKALSLITIGFLVGGFFLWGQSGKNPTPEFEPVAIADATPPEDSPAVQHAKLTTLQEPEPDFEDPRDMSPDSWSQPVDDEEEEPQAPYLTFDENGMVVDSHLGNTRKRSRKLEPSHHATSSSRDHQEQMATDSSSSDAARQRPLTDVSDSDSRAAKPVEYGKLPESESIDFAPLAPAPTGDSAPSPFVNQPPLTAGEEDETTGNETDEYDLSGRESIPSEANDFVFPDSRPADREPERDASDTSPWNSDSSSSGFGNDAMDDSSAHYDLGQDQRSTNKSTWNSPAENRSESHRNRDAETPLLPMQRNPFYNPDDESEPELPVDPNLVDDEGAWRNPKFQTQPAPEPTGVESADSNGMVVESPIETQPQFKSSWEGGAQPTPVALPENGAGRMQPEGGSAAPAEPIYRNPQFNASRPAVPYNASPSATSNGIQACDACDSAVSQPCVDCGRAVIGRSQSRCDGCLRSHRQSADDCGLSGPLYRRRHTGAAAASGFGNGSVVPSGEYWDTPSDVADYPPKFNAALGFRQPSPTSRSQDVCGHPYSQSGEHYPSFGEILRTSRYFVSTDLMLLKPHFQDNTVINIANGGTTWGESLDFNHDPAFQVQAGFISPFGPGAGLDYFQYDQNAATRTFVSDGMTTATTRVIIPGGGGVSEIAATMPGESLSVDHSLEVHSYGAFVFKALDFRRASLTGKFGVRKVHIDQRMSAVLRDSMNAFVADLQHVMDFDGFGPQFGLEYRRKIGHTPLIFLTSLNNSLIFGNRDERIQNSCACQFFHTSSDELITILDLYSGVEGRKFVGEKRFLFGRLGYVNQSWLGGGTALDARNDFGFQGFAFSFGYNR